MPRPYLPDSECNLLFFDSETGGLDPAESDFVEVAAVLTDKTGKHVIEEYAAKVIPRRPVHPKAAEVNGYDEEKWAAEGVDLRVAVSKISRMSTGALFVAHNAAFDWAFLQAAMAATGNRWNGNYHRLCTMTMAMPLHRAGHLENIKLQTLAAYFGLDAGEAHRALSDTRTCRQVFLKLMPAYEAAITALIPAKNTPA